MAGWVSAYSDSNGETFLRPEAERAPLEKGVKHQRRVLLNLRVFGVPDWEALQKLGQYKGWNTKPRPTHLPKRLQRPDLGPAIIQPPNTNPPCCSDTISLFCRGCCCGQPRLRRSYPTKVESFASSGSGRFNSLSGGAVRCQS